MAAWGIMPVCMALVVASIGIFANAFSFFLGQAVRPMVYGVALPAIGGDEVSPAVIPVRHRTELLIRTAAASPQAN